MDVTTTLLIVVILGLAGLGFVVWRTRRTDNTLDKSTEIILQQLNDLRRDVDTKLGESTKTMHDSLCFKFFPMSSFTSKAAMPSMPLWVIKNPFIMPFD